MLLFTVLALFQFVWFMHISKLCRLDKLQQKLKQQTLQALALHDELQDVRGNKESQIQNLENNFMQMQKLKQETDQSKMFLQLSQLNFFLFSVI